MKHLQRLIALEMEQYGTNSLKPYQSNVTPSLYKLSSREMDSLLNRVEKKYLRYIFLESFMAPHPQVIASWLSGVQDDSIVRLFAALDADDDGRRQILALLEHLPEDRAFNVRQAIAARQQEHAPNNATPLSCRPSPHLETDQSRKFGNGLHWTKLTGTTPTRSGPWPLQVDLLAMDMDRIRLSACRAVPENRLIPITAVQSQLGSCSRDSKRPEGTLFDSLGLVRLSDVVRDSGAIAGINGGFYFDYGHYLDALDLGIDMTALPGLAFGELSGWFVSNGKTDVPPLFNRAALFLTSDGKTRIRRVFIKSATINGRKIQWDSLNKRESDHQVVLYNTISGNETPRNSGVTDITIARGKVLDIRRGGRCVLPLWGAVLSVPESRLAEFPEILGPGALVLFQTDLPKHQSQVMEAMASGPLLVRDGKIDIDFDTEQFGWKDTNVLPISLTRAKHFFRAARSFIMIRKKELVFGTVSGEALGRGRPERSAGMTFNEVAKLAVSLGAEQAIGLDGGGSSTLVAMNGGIPNVLNVPTGGADVACGAERYINTYWLVFKRE